MNCFCIIFVVAVIKKKLKHLPYLWTFSSLFVPRVAALNLKYLIPAADWYKAESDAVRRHLFSGGGGDR